MSAFRKKLEGGARFVCDGAMGTMIMARGFDSLSCPEALNLEHPEVLEEIAAAYIDSGSDIVTTNTFGGSPLKLAASGIDADPARVNHIAVQAARRAAGVGAGRFVAGSCGPTGKILLPYGDTEPEEVRDGFVTQIGALVEGGVDVIFVETMTDLGEALLAARAAREISSDIPLAVTLTFDPTPKGFFTMMGNTIDRVAGALEQAGVDILGTNCGNGMEAMIRIATEFRAETDRPILVQANAGLPEIDDDGNLLYPESPEFFGTGCEKLLEAGTMLIGGCCGSGPDHIRAIRKAVDRAGRSRVPDSSR